MSLRFPHYHEPRCDSGAFLFAGEIRTRCKCVINSAFLFAKKKMKNFCKNCNYLLDNSKFRCIFAM